MAETWIVDKAEGHGWRRQKPRSTTPGLEAIQPRHATASDVAHVCSRCHSSWRQL